MIDTHLLSIVLLNLFSPIKIANMVTKNIQGHRNVPLLAVDP